MRSIGVVIVATAALTLVGCSGGNGGTDAATSPPPAPATTAAPPTPTPTPTPTRASPVPGPPRGACYRLSYDAALAPSSRAVPVPCGRRHTAQTFAVADLDPVLAGHLLAVDSTRIQAQVARECPRRLSRFLGGTRDEQRLTVLRAVWFTPTVTQSDAGATWFRCDVIAVAAQGELSPLPGRLAGVLDEQAGRDTLGVCGTAEPGTAIFERVVCSREHSWRAIATVELPAGRYPGRRAARDAGQEPCEDAGRAAAEDALDFQWGYEWPTARQWRTGQTYGLCWAPG